MRLVPGGQIETREDVVSALSADPRLAGWSVEHQEDGYLELARGQVVLVLAWPQLWRDPDALAPHLTRARSGNYSLLLVGGPGDLASGAIDDLAGGDAATRVGLLAVPTSPGALALLLRSWGETERRLRELAEVELGLERARYENSLLIDIGRALSQQRDLAHLLNLILHRAREVTGADAGSVYVVEPGPDGDPDPARRVLRFVESQNDSIVMESHGFTMPVSPSSIVGACTLAGEVINIPDLYALDPPGTGNNPW